MQDKDLRIPFLISFLNTRRNKISSALKNERNILTNINFQPHFLFYIYCDSRNLEFTYCSKFLGQSHKRLRRRPPLFKIIRSPSLS